MPDTPFAWAPAVTVNVSTGFRNWAPDIIQLNSGEIAVAWMTDDTAIPGQGAGNDVFARKYDLLGDVAPGTGHPGGNYSLDLRSSYSSDMTVIAYPGATRGAGVIVSTASGNPTGERANIAISEVFADLSQSAPVNSLVQGDSSELLPNYADPHMALFSPTNALIVFEKNGEDGVDDGEIMGRIYDPESNDYQPRFSIIDLPRANVSDPHTTALTNGNYAVVARYQNGADSEILMRVVGPDGTMITATAVLASTRGNGQDTQPVVQAIGTPGNDGYVVAWQKSGDQSGVYHQLFSNDGVPITAARATGTGGSEPQIAALNDRGYVIVQTLENGIEMRRFALDGTAVGDPVVVAGTGLGAPTAHQLDDDRIVLAWTDGSDVRMQIFDIRDGFSLGRHPDGNWLLGTEGNDALVDIGEAIYTTMHGWNGDDTITAAATGGRAILGGAGDDYVTAGVGVVPDLGRGADDLFDGGPGFDTVDFSRVDQAGLTFDLAAGLLRLDQSTQTRVLRDFEHLIGTVRDDRIVDDDGDTRLEGGDGNDLFTLGAGRDTVDGGAGTDSIVFRDQAVDITANLASGQIVQGAAAKSVAGIEDITTGDGDDRLTGDTAANRLAGGDGDDWIYGDGLKIALVPQISAQVFRLYQATLDRAPDAGGHLGWSSRLFENTLDLLQAADSFIASREFFLEYGQLDNAGFVGNLYTNVLGRTGSAAEVTGWTDLMAGGLTRAQVVLGFSESAEFIAKTRAASDAFALANTDTVWTDDVYRLYQATLDRLPDAPGLRGWTGQLGSGTPFDTVVAGFVGSTEFQNTYGTLDNSGFVNLLYTNVLGRPGEAAGVAGWLDLLDNGTSRETVVQGFSQSREFINATAAPLTAWVRAQGQDDTLVGGEGANTLMGGMMSDSFVFSFQGRFDTRVVGFEPWDVLDFTGFNYATPGEVLGRMSQSGSDVVFADFSSTLTLTDTSLSQIDESMILV
ncbi:MAG: DUF4214 domain-containing protein [Rhodobacteraceae bacterium]|nr:DUF4214 domain-containing protein [Paracoccaceae bacterium]